ncbi:hypothetical protein Sfum_3642 [Syntrophobacter fumaroxidans MPOB]|uniref:Uncharacterized protein n=1 Tax=Syntrophobacter fumaroxidans (strain DSM 10017 / MPOB) TaxID=335543 RepID=A0LPG0_SYNFM|nr:hypothetical protein Sfum_3642 [Syntrophobacter fumaroxidans MPOB]
MTSFQEILQGCERGGRDRLRFRGNGVLCQLLSRAARVGCAAAQSTVPIPLPLPSWPTYKGRAHIRRLFRASKRGAGVPGLPSEGLSGCRGNGVSTGFREPRTDGLEWPGEGIGRLETRKMPCPAGLFCICIDLLRKNVPLRGLCPISGEERPGI